MPARVRPPQTYGAPRYDRTARSSPGQMRNPRASGDFVPSSWGMYYPTVWDWSTYLGTIGVFLALMFLFVRGLPAISIFEMREVVHETEPTHGHGD